MFEKEAEEYFRENAYNFDEVTACRECMEIGYNKANEWNKGELPQITDKNKETLYLAWTKYGRAGSPCIVTPLKEKYMNLWTGAIVDKEDVVSWQEIILPTE